MEEILEAVCWHVEQSGFKDVIRSGMVLTGGGSKIKNLTNLANFVTGYDARVGSPNVFAIDPSSCDLAKEPTSSTAAGMLIHAFQRMEEEGIIFTNCVSSVEEPVFQPVEENAEPVLIDAETSSQVQTVSPSPKAGKKTGKNFWKKIKGAFDSEGLFSSEYSNEV